MENEFISMIQEDIGLIVKQVDNPEFNILYNFLDERISAPESFVVMLGETSSGKSTLVNGLLGSFELAVGASPTTGTIVEILDDNKINDIEYYAVNKNATIEKLSKNEFDTLLKNPDDYLLRLRLYIKKFNYDLQFLRIFDTPGYGSIQKYHEEIINEFIPQSDIVIYVVSYRVGFQNYDNNFVSFIYNLIDEETKFYLVINRVPEGVDVSDKRIYEITQHASDCLHRELSPYIVKSVNNEENTYVLPKANDLWTDVSSELKSEDRLLNISITYLYLQKDILIEIENYFNNILLSISLSFEQKKELSENLKFLLNTKVVIIEKINNKFDFLNRYVISLFENASKSIKSDISKEINIANKWSDCEDCTAFITSHLLTIKTNHQIKIITDALQAELSILNDEIDHILNNALIEFENNIKISNVEFKNLFKETTNKALQKFAGYGLQKFFAQYGGAGGTGAGVANFAKKGLKNLGVMIGKKFSRETHNAVAKFVSKIGATSVKALTIFAAVIIESIIYIYNSKTWQKELIKLVNNGVDNWKNEQLQKTQKEINNLREININNINEYFKQYELSFKFENDKTKLKKDKIELILSKVNNLKNQIDLKLNKLKKN
jgi:energy-coupling factor transporter ATP-binding protein EcfA2